MTTDELLDGIRVRREGAIEFWTLDRPDRMNALSRATVRRLGALARQAAEDASVRVVVLAGAGERAFCAGADLKERKDMTQEDVRDFLGLYRSTFDAIDRLPQPILAAIDGVAYGGGLELALACDLRVMSPKAKVGLTEVSLAIIPGAGGTQRLTRLVGPAIAKDLILFARRLEADEALALGIVTRVSEPGQSARDLATSMAHQLASSAPIAVRAALSAIDAATEMTLDAGLLHERRCYEQTLNSQDRLEALAAFREKRPPKYKGH